MSDNDNDSFAQAMGDVEPLRTDKRVTLKADDKAAKVGLEHRRQAAEALPAADENALAGDFIEPVAPLDILSYRQPGVQHGVFRNLRLGKYAIDARLDLHRMSVERARDAVYQFVRDCLEHDIRCVLITHGKGLMRQPQPALLKSCVAHWLPQLPQVLAFHSAQPRHGGAGATYVLLRKSDRQRQENKERHAARRKV
ncbi:DNA endonuclease SmrA [Exilibacterium tricleocarpae]|uniref:DNA endonuclease SmrA n=1 Tax=Exilibacterium tricleocarpae TaxID=2591008 RepID=A0A545SMF5_9GAMM|nr:DNA endonuclease SmrA [Exilibacterium tricleocarpae]TQV66159.1 DNA endonuclease SmrA [Exilibacterium tricleocarpae]